MKLKYSLLLANLALSVTPAFAQSVWSGGAGNWSSDITPGWNGTGVPNAIDATADAQALGGTLTVNGNFIVGTLTQLGTAGRSVNATGTNGLTFDVSAGTALWDMRGGLTGTGTSGGTSHSTNITLNDNTEIRGLVSTGSSGPTLGGKISGAGQLILTNVATTPVGGGIRMSLNNGTNDFSGGINLGLGVALRLNASGAAGSGTITLADSPAAGLNNIDFRVDTANATQVHANNINFGTRVSGGNNILTLQNNTMNVTLNGVLSGTMGSSGRASLNGGTLVLGGASPNIWTGQFRSDSHGMIIADKVGAINNGMSMRSSTANTQTSLLVGVSDTITGQISVDGQNTGAANSYTVQLGLKNGNNGSVTFSNANKINLAQAWGNGGTVGSVVATSLNLHSGNGNGTLNVTTEIGTNNVVTDARNISITGTGTVKLNRSGGNTYGGTTSVVGGTLLANNSTGSATSLGAVNVSTGATLGGIGSIAGTVDISGVLSPGDAGIGTLTVGNDVTWNAGNSWVFELGSSASSLALADSGGSIQDMLDLTGAGSDFLKGSGTGWTFDFSGSGASGWYKLAEWDGTTTFADTDFTASNLANGLSGTFTVDGGTSALYLNVIPEPGSVLLGGLGMLVLLRRRRD